MNHELILTETRGRVGLITLNRPKALNALNDQVMDEISAALDAFEADEGIGAIVITGSDRAFAAGADIGAMADYSYMDAYKGDYITRNWERVKTCRKPIIAAVAGFALGGGCELAMTCDIIIAADFSLPVVMMIKESVNRAFESSLGEGLLFERRVFHSSFALNDQKEGMAAFVEKRKPSFRHD